MLNQGLSVIAGSYSTGLKFNKNVSNFKLMIKGLSLKFNLALRVMKIYTFNLLSSFNYTLLKRTIFNSYFY